MFKYSQNYKPKKETDYRIAFWITLSLLFLTNILALNRAIEMYS